MDPSARYSTVLSRLQSLQAEVRPLRKGGGPSPEGHDNPAMGCMGISGCPMARKICLRPQTQCIMSSVVLFRVAGIMECFLVVKKPLLNVTTKDLIKRVMYSDGHGQFYWASHGTAYNEAQKAVSSLACTGPVSQQRALIVAAARGKADWCRILPHLQPLSGMVQARLFAVPQCFCKKLLPEQPQQASMN